MDHDAPAPNDESRVRRAASLFDLSAVPRAAIVATLASNLLNLALPLVVLQVYDRIIPNQATETLVVLVGAMMVVITVDLLLKLARSYLLGWQSAERAASASLRAAAIIAEAPCAMLARERHTDWLDRIEAAAQVETGRGGQAQLVVLDFLFLPIFPLVIAVIAGYLVVIPVAITCVLGFVIWRNGAELGEAIADRSRHDRRRFDFLTECLSAIETVKALAMEPQMVRRFERLAKSNSLISFRTIAASQALQTLAGIMANLTLIAVVSSGALFIMRGDLTVGGLACCSLLAGRMMQPVLRAAGVWADVQNQQHARDRAAPLDALVRPAAAVRLPRRDLPARIVLEDVCFRDSHDRTLLDRVSLEVKPGAIIGLTGDTAGWAAAFDIICGDLEASSGRVLVDGVAAAQVGGELRRQLVRVSATSQLFRGTVLENLTVFEGGSTVDLARAVARELGLEARINRLPRGFDTEVGSSANLDLPGGVCQQIVITRALVRRPRALLFNEANSALDAESDAALRRVLAALAGQVSVMIVSNRPSLLNIAKRSFVLTNGRVAAAEGGAGRRSTPSVAVERKLAG